MTTHTLSRRRARRFDVGLGSLADDLRVLSRLDGEPVSAIVRAAVRRYLAERREDLAAARHEAGVGP